MIELVQWRNDWRGDQTRWTMETQFIDESYNKRQVNRVSQCVNCFKHHCVRVDYWFFFWSADNRCTQVKVQARCKLLWSRFSPTEGLVEKTTLVVRQIQRCFWNFVRDTRSFAVNKYFVDFWVTASDLFFGRDEHIFVSLPTSGVSRPGKRWTNNKRDCLK